MKENSLEDVETQKSTSYAKNQERERGVSVSAVSLRHRIKDQFGQEVINGNLFLLAKCIFVASGG